MNKDKTKKLNNKNLLVVFCILLLLVISAGILGGLYLISHNSLLQITQSNNSNQYISLGKINVNLADEGGKVYFKGELSVGYDEHDRNAKKELTKEKKLVVVRDVVNFYFKSKNSEFIRNIDNEAKIKEELLNAINSDINNFKITDIRFNAFIVQ